MWTLLKIGGFVTLMATAAIETIALTHTDWVTFPAVMFTGCVTAIVSVILIMTSWIFPKCTYRGFRFRYEDIQPLRIDTRGRARKVEATCPRCKRRWKLDAGTQPPVHP